MPGEAVARVQRLSPARLGGKGGVVGQLRRAEGLGQQGPGLSRLVSRVPVAPGTAG